MPTRSLPAWLENAVVYQIYPQTFQDSNGDGVGDLPGMISRLDYIASLGVEAIWLNPVFCSTFRDGGYDITDFCKIDPRYGTQADIEAFITGCKQRGIRVLFDLVAGHTSLDHPWFQASASPHPNPYSNYYVWTHAWWQRMEGGIGGYSERNGCFLPNFFYSQPALNYGYHKITQPWQLAPDHPDCLRVREELKNIMRHWLRLGVAGFRVDMAPSLIKADDAKKTGNIALWRELRAMLDAEFPGTVLVSEWGNPRQALQAGFDIDFILPFPDENRIVFSGPEERGVVDYSGSWFNKRGLGRVAGYLDGIQSQLLATRGLGHIALVTGGHDIERVNFERTTDELEAIFAFAFSLPNVPFLYYGDEIGLRQRQPMLSKERGYNRTSARTPMQWDATVNAGFSTAPADRLYTSIDPTDDRPTVAAQERDPNSLLNRIRRLVNLKKTTPALAASAPFEILHLGAKQYPLVYRRGDDRRGHVLGVFNPSGDAVEAEISFGPPALSELRNQGVTFEKIPGGWRFRCAPGSFALLGAAPRS